MVHILWHINTIKMIVNIKWRINRLLVIRYGTIRNYVPFVEKMDQSESFADSRFICVFISFKNSYLILRDFEFIFICVHFSKKNTKKKKELAICSFSLVIHLHFSFIYLSKFRSSNIYKLKSIITMFCIALLVASLAFSECWSEVNE